MEQKTTWLNGFAKILFTASFSLCITLLFTANKGLRISGARSLFSALNGNNILSVPLFFVFYPLLYKMLPAIKRAGTGVFLCSSLFALCETVGYNIKAFGKLIPAPFGLSLVLFNIIVFWGYFALFLLCLSFIFEKLSHASFDSGIKKINPKIGSFDFDFLFRGKKAFFITAGCLVFFWSFYYILFFPGIVTWDSYYQINQGLFFRPLTDENPFLHTLIQGRIIALGRFLFGTINTGVALAAFLQMSCMAFIGSFIVQKMKKLGLPGIVCLVSLLFYSLNPLFGTYSITLWKDIWMAAFLVLYGLMLTEACIDIEAFVKKKTNFLILSGVILAIFFSKGTGIALLILSYPSLFFVLKKKRISMLMVFAACLTVYLIVRSTVIPSLGIQKGYIREPLSVPLQQIARTVKYHDADLSPAHKKIINEVLPYESLSALYDPILSDNVKGTFNGEAFTKDPLRYAKLWLTLGFKHPKTYVESFLCNSHGYWYPEAEKNSISNNSYYSMLQMYKNNGWTVYDKDIDSYTDRQALREGTAYLLNNIKNIPVFTVLFSIAAYFWISLICFLAAIRKKRYYTIPLHTVILAVFLTCVCSPVHAETRYAYAAILALPVTICFSLFASSCKNNPQVQVKKIKK